jgi:transketolase
VWTHDSVGVGEDGPTHQPVEHYAALRAIPHLWVIRPADANETSAAWRVALAREDGPVALLLSRQNLPVLAREDLDAAAASDGAGEPLGLLCASAEGLERGAYVLWDSAVGAPELLLIATGSEVSLALEAARELAAQGTHVRVVSMPCMELFEAQSRDYRDEVLPPQTTERLAVETGVSMSWWKWVGSAGDVLGIDHFGASAPGPTVLEKFGFTAESVLVRARALLGS